MIFLEKKRNTAMHKWFKLISINAYRSSQFLGQPNSVEFLTVQLILWQCAYPGARSRNFFLKLATRDNNKGHLNLCFMQKLNS